MRIVDRSEVEKFAYRIDEAATALGLARTSVYKMIKSGELKAIKLAGRTLIPRSEMERLTKG